METITEFKGEYDFLDNAYVAHIRIGTNFYMCAEAAYQAMRISDPSMRGMFSGMHAKEARVIGMFMPERKDWDDVKWNVLLDITREKFKQNPVLLDKLLKTGDSYINDDFLGKILMVVRQELCVS